MQELQFVNVTGSAKVDKQARHTIRSQVTKDYYKKMRHGRVELRELDTANATPIEFEASKGRFRLTSNSYEKKATEVKVDVCAVDPDGSGDINHGLITQPTKVKIPNDLGSNNMDPFDAMSLSITPQCSEWIHEYFTSYSAFSALVMEGRRSYFAMAMHGRPFFHAAMSHYAASFSKNRRESDPVEALAHRTQAIALVNERLNQPGMAAVSDETIGTVASIAQFSACNAPSETVIIHINGLERMINARGGMRNAGFSAPLQRLIGWADLCSANALNASPRLLPFSCADADIAFTESIFAAQDAASGKEYQPRRDDMKTVLWKLRFLTRLALHGRRARSIENRTDDIYLIQRTLTYIITEQRGPVKQPLDEPCAIAALLYVTCCLKDIHMRTQIAVLLVTRLKASLEQNWALVVDAIGSGRRELGMQALWAVVFGGICAHGKPERAWFVVQLAVLCEALALRTWGAVTAVLDGFLWEFDWEQPRGALWAEVLDVKK